MIPKVRITLRTDSLLSINHQRIYGCEEAAPIFTKEIGMNSQETLALICLDEDYRFLNYSNINYGKINEVSIDHASLFKTVLLSNASYIIIGHNHPSGLLNPSESDIQVTKKIDKICKIFSVKLLDSIIVGPTIKYYSIRSNI